MRIDLAKVIARRVPRSICRASAEYDKKLDTFFTGTPAGCGMSRDVFLKPGDQIEIVVKGLGELCNPVVAD